ncbi:hypothetical protein MP638_007361 [Amoeboaphelidium occidentale]|nr:hypothetical protein MP638_007361 [Amoeboaphelidium occidentale]
MLHRLLILLLPIVYSIPQGLSSEFFPAPPGVQGAVSPGINNDQIAPPSSYAGDRNPEMEVSAQSGSGSGGMPPGIAVGIGIGFALIVIVTWFLVKWLYENRNSPALKSFLVQPTPTNARMSPLVLERGTPAVQNRELMQPTPVMVSDHRVNVQPVYDRSRNNYKILPYTPRSLQTENINNIYQNTPSDRNRVIPPQMRFSHQYPKECRKCRHQPEEIQRKTNFINPWENLLDKPQVRPYRAQKDPYKLPFFPEESQAPSQYTVRYI